MRRAQRCCRRPLRRARARPQKPNLLTEHSDLTPVSRRRRWRRLVIAADAVAAGTDRFSSSCAPRHSLTDPSSWDAVATAPPARRRSRHQRARCHHHRRNFCSASGDDTWSLVSGTSSFDVPSCASLALPSRDVVSLASYAPSVVSLASALAVGRGRRIVHDMLRAARRARRGVVCMPTCTRLSRLVPARVAAHRADGRLSQLPRRRRRQRGARARAAERGGPRRPREGARSRRRRQRLGGRGRGERRRRRRREVRRERRLGHHGARLAAAERGSRRRRRAAPRRSARRAGRVVVVREHVADVLRQAVAAPEPVVAAAATNGARPRVLAGPRPPRPRVIGGGRRRGARAFVQGGRVVLSAGPLGRIAEDAGSDSEEG